MLQTWRLFPDQEFQNPGCKWGVFQLIGENWVLLSAHGTKRQAGGYMAYLNRVKKVNK